MENEQQAKITLFACSCPEQAGCLFLDVNYSISNIYIYIMDTLIHQIKARRLALGLKQNDMLLRIGMSRQQYQQLEAHGNPRLDTLELIAKGLNSELLLIPRERLSTVIAVLAADDAESSSASFGNVAGQKSTAQDRETLSADPWRGLLGDEL